MSWTVEGLLTRHIRRTQDDKVLIVVVREEQNYSTGSIDGWQAVARECSEGGITVEHVVGARPTLTAMLRHADDYGTKWQTMGLDVDKIPFGQERSGDPVGTRYITTILTDRVGSVVRFVMSPGYMITSISVDGKDQRLGGGSTPTQFTSDTFGPTATGTPLKFDLGKTMLVHCYKNFPEAEDFFAFVYNADGSCAGGRTVLAE